MANITKTVGTSVLAWADQANATSRVSSTQSVTTALAAAVHVYIGRGTGTAFTAGSEPTARVEVSAKSSGDDWFTPVAQFQMATGASIANTTLNGAVSAAASTIVVNSATNIAAGDILLIEDSSASNYELARVLSVSSTTITLETALTNGHSNGAAVRDQAEMYVVSVDLSATSRLRVVVNNAASGQAVRSAAYMVTADSIG